MGGIRRSGDPLELFESGRAIQALRYICANEGCLKTDLYRSVSRSARMPIVIDGMEDAGLIWQEIAGRSTRLHPTEAGRRVERLFSEISDVMEHHASNEPECQTSRCGRRLPRAGRIFIYHAKLGPGGLFHVWPASTPLTSVRTA